MRNIYVGSLNELGHLKAKVSRHYIGMHVAFHLTSWRTIAQLLLFKKALVFILLKTLIWFSFLISRISTPQTSQKQVKCVVTTLVFARMPRRVCGTGTTLYSYSPLLPSYSTDDIPPLEQVRHHHFDDGVDELLTDHNDRQLNRQL